MNYEKGKELVLDDNKAFIIVDSFELNGNKYLYIISEDDKKSSLVKIINDTIYEIENDEEFNQVLNEIISRNREEINEFLRETNE